MSNLATIVNNILADSGIDDINVIVSTGSYANPAWITALDWGKITGRPTTLSGYGITDAYTQTQVNTLLNAYVPYTGATTNVNLGVNSLTATGITVSKSAGVSIITFPAGTNDPAFISHTESTTNVGIMRFSVGDDNDTVDYFAFGNLNNPDAFRINSNGTVSTGVWQGSAIADAYISSAATWNAKQNAITLTTTGTSGVATFIGATLNIPNYGGALGAYLPLAGGVMTGQLSSTFISSAGALLLNSGDDSGASGNRVQIALGYDGSGTYKHYITTTHNNGTSALNAIKFYTSNGVMNGTFPTGAILGLSISDGNIASGNGTFSGNIQVGGVAIAGNSSSFHNTATETAVAIKQTSGSDSITLGLWNNATTSNNTFIRFFTEASATNRGTILYDRASNRLNIVGEGNGFLFSGGATFSSNVRADRFSSGDSPYSNVAYSIRGTITGNNDSWGIYQNVVFAPVANNALAVGYHAGGASSVNRGTFTGLSYRGFYHENLGANTGTGTLQTVYGVYIDSLTRGVSNYSAYFAQNVGIGNPTPSYLLDVSGNARFIASQPDIRLEATNVTSYSRVVFVDSNGNERAGVQYINPSFSESGRRQKFELFGNNGIDLVPDGLFNAPVLRLTATGSLFRNNLGVGGAAATYPLTVYNGSNQTTAAFGGTARGIRIDNDGTFSSGRSTIFGVDNTFYNSFQPLALTASVLYFAISGTDKMTLSSSGYLGINEMLPTSELHISKQTVWGTSTNRVININNTGTGGDINVAHNMGSITWYSGNSTPTAEIAAYRNTPASGNNIELRFFTASAGTPVESVRLGATGIATFLNNVFISTDNRGLIVDVASRHGLMKYTNVATGLVGATTGTDNNISTWLGRFTGAITSPSSILQDLVVTNSGRIGVNITNPQTFFNINRDFAVGSTQVDYLRLTSSQGGAWFSRMGLQFRWNDFGNGASWNLGSIEGDVDGWTNPNGGGALIFLTKTFGAYATDPTEKMRLTQGGRLQIGFSGVPSYTSYDLFVSRGDQFGGGIDVQNGLVRFRGDDDNLYINRAGTDVITVNLSNNVGIRNTSPAAYLDVMGVADQVNFSSLVLRAGNSDDATPESNQILLGYAGTRDYAHAIKTRHQSGTQAGNSIEFWVWKHGDAAATQAGQRVMVVEGNAVRIANGSGTINSLSASERLNVNGTVYATGYYETSDIRLKNVLSTTDGNIPAISYTWKDGRDNKLHWGYAAQDVMKYLPDAVSGSEYYGLDYNQVHTYKIAQLEARVKELEQQLKNK
jgi:hypothetical protein